jgi:ABC-type transport system involved in Fe-S cluster assembly fused permease/ATPase subunit
VVKAFGQEERELERFNRISGHLMGTRRRVDMSAATFNPFMALIFQLGGWIVWYIGGRDVLGAQMTLGSLIAYLGYLVMFYGPLTTLTQFTNWLTQFATQAHRIFEILDTPVEIAETENPETVGALKGEVTFDGVTFGYNRYSPALNNVSLHIEPGEMIGIVGRSGSGKTTIVNLIGRFYDVNEGCVKVDGVDVRRIRKEELRRNIGIVLQDPFLFRGSIYDNLTYGKPGCQPEEVIASAKAASAHDFIMRKAQAYDTWVGEQGSGLSGGERQRTAIARVLLTDPRILILDEATSSVDAESESAIQAALAEIIRGRTTIAIAHRLSTLRNANRILVVDNGQIVESGAHEELIAGDGLYAHLVRIQGQMTMPSVERLSVETEKVDDILHNSRSPLAHPLSHHIRWLDVSSASVHLDHLGTLHVDVAGEGTYRGIYTLRCFPVHHPERYISLRFLNSRKREVEVGIIKDLGHWPEETRRIIQESLIKRYFLHVVKSIKDIQVYGSYLEFRVETDLGPMEFMMRWQGDRAQDYGQAGKLLIDTEENRFLIPDVQTLPERERSHFQRYIYW